MRNPAFYAHTSGHIHIQETPQAFPSFSRDTLQRSQSFHYKQAPVSVLEFSLVVANYSYVLDVYVYD